MPLAFKRGIQFYNCSLLLIYTVDFDTSMTIMASASLAIINEVITLSDDDDEIIELAQVRMPWNIHAQSTSPSRGMGN